MNSSTKESKRVILDAIRAQSVDAVMLPELADLGTHYDDLVGHFAKVLHRIGGVLLQVSDRAQMADAIRQLDVYKNASQIVAQFSDVRLGNVDLDHVSDPRELDQLDLAILPGEFAVAENAAVWVTDREQQHRVVYVIAEHLILYVDAMQLVHNMHEAYQRLSFDRAGYGLFIAGPSKTADIGATLVKGAQGACTYHVILLGSSPDL